MHKRAAPWTRETSCAERDSESNDAETRQAGRAGRRQVARATVQHRACTAHMTLRRAEGAATRRRPPPAPAPAPAAPACARHSRAPSPGSSPPDTQHATPFSLAATDGRDGTGQEARCSVTASSSAPASSLGDSSSSSSFVIGFSNSSLSSGDSGSSVLLAPLWMQCRAA